MALTIALAGAALALVPAAAAQAGIVQWGTAGGTAPNYQATVNGDFIMAGNGVLACSGVYLPGTAGTANTCNDLHAASSTNANNVNDNFSMVNSNTVAGFTANSSTANVTIPAGATVVKAFLNWSSNTGLYTGDARTLCAAYSAQRGTATLPAGAVDAYLTQNVQLKVGGAAVSNVAPASVLVDPTTQATSRYYSAGADVTSAFAGVTTGSAVAISAGNIWAPNGAGCYAGWSLTLIYDYGTLIAGNSASDPHKVMYYEGQVRQGAADAALAVNFNNFTAVGAGSRAGFTLFEGDRNITGDTFSYARNASTTFAEIPNSAGATGNFGISRGLNSVRYTQTANVTAFTNQSVDVTTSSLTNVVTGDTSVDLSVATAGDSYLLRNAILSVPVPGLKVVKTLDGTVDTQSRTGTEAATFTITVTNVGAGTLQNIAIVDDQSNCTRNLPAGTTLAPLQTFTYTCVANGVTTASYTSTANATATTVAGGFLAYGTDSTNVVFTAIGLTKTSALASGATGRAGDVVNYTFVVTNTGKSSLTGVSITDPLSGLSALTYSWPAAVGALATGQSATATATYVLTQTDVDAGSVPNTATTTATDNDGGVKPTAQASRTTTVASAPALAVTKSGTYAPGATGKVGDVIVYSFTIKNTGNVTLTNTTLVDPLPGLSPPVITWPSATAGTLAPGATATATATYTITQANFDAGAVNNTATANGKPPTGANVSASSPSTTVPTATAAPAIVTTKSGVLAAGATGAAGDTVNYSFSLKNTGNVTLTAVSLVDPLPGLSALTYTWPGTAGTLAPGQTVTATASYILKQSDVDAGSVANTVTGSGKPPTGANVSGTSPATVPVSANPSLLTTKSGTVNSPGTGVVGNVITYTFSTKNTGNVTLTSVVINDPLPGLSARTYTWPGTAGTLAPGQTVTATATYTITQADVDTGSVRNTATATGRTPGGATVLRASPQVIVPTVAPAPAITTTKSATVAGGGAVDSVVTYSLSAKNTGNVTLTGVTISDPLPGLSAITYGTWPSGTVGTLAPGQTVTATATYTITQADVDAKSIKNTAVSTGTAPSGATTSGSSPQVTTPTIASAPATVLTKSGALATGGTPAPGHTINYSFSLKNTGNVTLIAVAISDPLPGLSALTYTWPGTAGTLAPGQTVTATATYAVTQTDLDAGSVANTASSTATPPTGAALTRTAPATVPLTRSPSIAVTKAGSIVAPGTGLPGDVIQYSFTITNPGNVTLTGVTLTDSKPGVSTPVISWPGASGVLAPGQTATATANYTLTQADVDTGSVQNIATAAGSPPTGPKVNAVSDQSTVSTAASAPAITTAKSGGIAPGETGAAGDTVQYTFTATNTGNVTLTGVSIADPKPGLSALSYTPWPGAVGTLAPGESITATAVYLLTQSDVNTGSVSNTAISSGTPPTGVAVTGPSPTVSVLTEAATPAITLAKAGALASGSTGVAGNTVNYSFSVTNTGNVTVTSVAISDPLPGLSALTYTWPATAGTLQPGQTATATATYLVTQVDVDAGSIANTATVGGTPSSGAPVSATDPNTIPIAPAGSLVVTKSGSIQAPGTGLVGDIVDYSFAVRNSGNVTVTGVTLTDPKPGLSTLVITWPGTPGTLAPGQSATATAQYTITQADVDAGSVKNTATASGTTPTGASVTASSPQVVVPTAAPLSSLTTTKSGATAGTGAVGDVVTFTISSRNSGNVTLTEVAINDTLPGLSALTYTWPGVAGVLPPGQSVTATATYTITQADVDAGSVKNIATVSGTAPSGSTTTGPSPLATVPTVSAAPVITVEKTAALTGSGTAGDQIDYAFTFSNTGNVTLTGVTLSDSLLDIQTPTIVWPGAPGVLAPGEFATATAGYSVKQTDVDAGSVANVVTASGNPPTGSPATTTDSATVPLAPAPLLEVTKSGSISAPGTGLAGDVIQYSFTITNTGNVTVSAITLSDSRPGVSVPVISWPAGAGVLAPGEVATATAQYTITQADVDTGSVSNTATADGRTPDGAPVSAPSPESIVLTAAPAPAITTAKSGTVRAPGTGAVGDTIDYTFEATNNGNVTLTGVTISDALPGLSSIAYGPWPGTPGTLSPGQSISATARYTITQADVDASAVLNTASSAGTPPTGAAVSSPSSPVVVPTESPAGVLQLEKTAATAGGFTGRDGDRVNYTFTLSNLGNVTLTEVAIADPLPGLSVPVITWPGTAGTLAPGETATATATYQLTQADVDSGAVSNIATVNASDPGGSPLTATDAATVAIASSAGLTLAKDGAVIAPGLGEVGDTIQYTFIAKNTGNVTLTGVDIADPLPGLSAIDITWPATAGTLLPGESATGLATYVITQADLNNQVVVNRATAQGATPSGDTVTADSPEVIVPTIEAGPAIKVDKTGVAQGSGALGDTIVFTMVVRNTGNVTLTGVDVSDDLPGIGAVTFDTWPGAVGTLAPGETVTATATYSITQADVDAGVVRNTATANGTDPGGNDIVGQSVVAEVPTVASDPSIAVTHGGSLAPGSTGVPGDQVDWTYALTNTGNVTLTGVQLTALLPNVSGITYVWPGTPGVLLPGQTVTAVASYLLTQTDVDAGAVSSTVVGTGTPPRGADASATAPATVPIGQVPSILVTKSGALAGGASGLPGDTIDYSFTIQNTGTVTLTSVDLTDSLVGVSAPVITWPGASGRLAPNEIATGTATYIVTQTDVDRGFVDNTASTSGRTPSGSTITDASPVATVPLAAPNPALLTEKTGSVAGGGNVGDLITWSLTITNTGNVTLTSVAVADPLPGLSAVVITWPSIAGTLAPGEAATATAFSVVTQADVDAGSVQNVATSSAQSPNGGSISDPSDPAVVPTVAALADAQLVKTGTLAPGSTASVGDTINYSFSYKNTGNVTLNDVVVADPLAGLSALTFTWPGGAGTLMPDQIATATATYVLTQADVDAGSVANLATASATPTRGDLVDRTAPATVPLASGPGIEVTKSGAIAVGDAGIAGDTIEYTFSVTNTGNVTLTGVTLDDALAGVSTPVVSWPGSDGVLAPGETATATATYALTQADVDTGSVSNTATATGTPPTGPAVDDTADALVTTAGPVPALATTKTAALTGSGVVGDTVIYTITSKNTGNVTLTDVTISDPLPGLSALVITWPGTPGTLAPGQAATATATYVLDQANVDSGQVANTATSSGASPAGAIASDPSDEVIVPTAPRTPSVAVTHDGVLAAGSAGEAGDTVEWSYTLTNTGNVTLTGVTLTDPQPGQTALTYSWPGTPGVLLPGQTVTATSRYILAQTDVDAGSVATTVTGSGTPLAGANATATAPATVAITPRPSFSATKNGTIRGGGIGAVGDVIDYSFSAVNTGNVTLTLVDIVDSLRGVSNLAFTWPGTPGILAPGETVTATADFTITQADIDSGAVMNIATVTGKPPTGQNIEVTTPASTVVVGSAAPAILTTKTAAVAGAGAVGDTITFTLTSENTGNVTLTSVAISDPLPGLSPIGYGPWPGSAVGTLAPGQSVSATATYTITQADVDHGTVDNVASSQGTPPTGPAVTDPSSAVSVPLVTAAPALTATKSGAISSTGEVGDTITWNLKLTNSGNVTISGASLSDSLTGISAISYGSWPSGTTGLLAPGQSVSATATSTITQADVDAGSVKNTAAATGNSPSGASVSAMSPEAVVPTVAADAAISISKQQVLAAGSTGIAGDLVQYRYQITNTGNQTLTDVQLTDPQPGLTPFTYSWPGTPGVLLPGQTVTVTATHPLTQAEVDAGGVSSPATTTGAAPNSTLVSDSAVANVTLAPNPSLAFDKTAQFETVVQEGARIIYGFRLVNTGNVTLDSVSLSDTLPGISAISYTWPGVPGVLAPGEVLTATATVTLTLADIDAGSIVNAATASTRTPGGTLVTATDSVTRAIANEPAITLTASVKLKDGQRGYAGDILEYTYVATNTGNTTLTGVQIIDPRTGLSILDYEWPGEPGVLLPGQSVTATATYVISAADEGKQLTTNAEVISTNDPDGRAVQGEALVAISLPTLPQTPSVPGLAYTGSDLSISLTAALALLLSGLVLIAVGHQRRRKVAK